MRSILIAVSVAVFAAQAQAQAPVQPQAKSFQDPYTAPPTFKGEPLGGAAITARATFVGTKPVEALQDNRLFVTPKGDAKGDFRAGNFEVQVDTPHQIEKIDALAGYAKQWGSGRVRDVVYGGTLQYMNYGGGGRTGPPVQWSPPGITERASLAMPAD